MFSNKIVIKLDYFNKSNILKKICFNELNFELIQSTINLLKTILLKYIIQLMDNSHFDSRHLYKILLVGGDKSGKTKILHKFISEMHAQNFKWAIGIEFGIETIIIEGKWTKIQISDTSR